MSQGYTVGEGRGAAYTGCGGEIAPPANADYEQQVVELVNAERAARGLPPLKRVAPLDEAARYHATDMGQDDYCGHDSHDRVDGQLVYVCSWDRRVGTYYTGWLCLAENIYCGGASPQSVMEDWMTSSKHRSNILHTHMWEIGVGYYEGSGAYRRYWVQDFGRRSDVYPLVINHEAATTVSLDVSLYAYGDWEMIRLRNNNADWSDWQAFRNTLTWTLSGESGEQTVWAEMRGGGQTVISSDSIYLTASTPTPSPTPPWTPTVTPTPTPTHTSTPTSTPTPTVTPTATPAEPWLNWARPHAPLFAAPGGWAADVIYGNLAVPAAFTATLTGAAVFVDSSQLLADTVTTVNGAYGLAFYSPSGAVAGDTFEVDIALSNLTLSGAGVVPWRRYLPLTWKE